MEDRAFRRYDPESEYKLICETADFLHKAGITEPEVAVILGSGLGGYADTLEDEISIPYSEIPDFASSTAPGHKGTLYYGKKAGKNVLVMGGRFHYYEGYPMHVVVFPTRVMGKLGIKRLIITNAAGGIVPEWPSGTLMVINDHINMTGINPLIGPNMSMLGTRFPDLTDLYNKDLRTELMARAEAEGIHLEQGVYVMMSGPSFETPAEIRFLRTIGGDAAGMSSVPEAIAAHHMGLEVMGISCIANAAAGVIPDKQLTGEEVLEESRKVFDKFSRVVDIAVSL